MGFRNIQVRLEKDFFKFNLSEYLIVKLGQKSKIFYFQSQFSTQSFVLVILKNTDKILLNNFDFFFFIQQSMIRQKYSPVQRLKSSKKLTIKLVEENFL